MNVTIQERKFALRSEYDITVPGDSYYAVRKLFSLHANLQVLTEDRRLLARILGHFSLFRSKYDFIFADGKLYRLWSEQVWKGVYACESPEEKFRLYTHKGVNYSIFNGDRQIAAFSRNRIVIGRGNRFDIQINTDANVLVVICMVLTVNTFTNDDDHATVTYDFGNIGPESRPFDTSWEPS